MASSEHSPQKRPVSTEAPSPPIKGYSDDEARDIYARAAEIQSQTAFEDDKLTPEMLNRSANRAGISDAALQQAIKERERDRVAALELEKSRAAQKSQIKRIATVSGVALALISGGTLLLANNSLSARNQDVQSAQSQVENVLERRHNLVPNLISLTKEGLQNQRALIDNLRLANDATQKALTLPEKTAAETQLSGAITKTFQAFRSDKTLGGGFYSRIIEPLRDEMAGAENRISVERRKYNQAVDAYNSAASSFPLGFAGRLLGYRARYDYFKASPGASETPKF